MKRRLPVALVAGLTLADASVVVLALPALVVELDASVEQVAAVIGVYTLALAGAALLGVGVRRALGARLAGALGALVFAGASAWCGAADEMQALLVARGVQALGAGLLLVAAFDLLDAPGAGARLWRAVAVFGTAAGPALGGALTELFDWRAIFYAQVPVALAGALACLTVRRAGRADGAARAGAAPARAAGGTSAGADWPGTPQRGAAGGPPAAWPGAAQGSATPVGARAVVTGAARVRAGIALGFVSAALTSVLFLLVLLLVSGLSLSPLAAAAVVSVLPVAAILAARIPGDPRTRAAAGCALVAGGVLALAFLPGASAGWTIAPQMLAGAGMGLVLPALAGGLLPERTPGQAAVLLSARHVGVTVALALLAPIVAAQLDDAVEDTRERGTALALDAKLSPLDKIDLAGVLLADIDPEDPRASLDRSFAAATREFDDDDQREAIAELRQRADDALVEGLLDAFAPAFLITGALAGLGALLILPRRAGRAAIAAGAIAVAAALPLAMALGRPSLAPEPVVIQDPCEERDLPDGGGITGFVQDAALRLLDRTACNLGSSREDLVLALADEDLARDFQREHGTNPRELQQLLRALAGF